MLLVGNPDCLSLLAPASWFNSLLLMSCCVHQVCKSARLCLGSTTTYSVCVRNPYKSVLQHGPPKDLGSPKEIHFTGHVLHCLPMGPLVVRDGYFYSSPSVECAGSLSVLGMAAIQGYSRSSRTKSAVPVWASTMLAPSSPFGARPVWPQWHCATPQAAAGPCCAPQHLTPCMMGWLSCWPSQSNQALVPGPPAKYPISRKRWRVVDKSREVISSVQQLKEGVKGMQRVPDHNFGEGLPFVVRR